MDGTNELIGNAESPETSLSGCDAQKGKCYNVGNGY